MTHKFYFTTCSVSLAVMIFFLRKRLFSVGKWIKGFSATYLVAIVVWVSGAASSLAEAFTPMSAGASTAGDLAGFFSFVLLISTVTSLSHQALVFHSLHEIDHNDALKMSLSGWRDTRVEWFIRLLCIFMLLCVAGEIPHLFQKIDFLISGTPQHGAHQGLFPVYSALLFLCLLAWDLGAFLTSRSKPAAGERLEKAYLYSDLFAFGIWVPIALSQCPYMTTNHPFLKMLPVMSAFFLLIYGWLIAVRIYKEIYIPSQKYV